MDPYKSPSLYWTPPAKVSSGTFQSFAISKLMHQVPLILRLVLWHIYCIHLPSAMARALHGVLQNKKIEIPLGPGIYPADSSRPILATLCSLQETNKSSCSKSSTNKSCCSKSSSRCSKQPGPRYWITVIITARFSKTSPRQLHESGPAVPLVALAAGSLSQV